VFTKLVCLPHPVLMAHETREGALFFFLSHRIPGLQFMVSEDLIYTPIGYPKDLCC
jgi:hypothetical protein